MKEQQREEALAPHVVDMTTRDGEYLEILSGAPQSAGMRAGVVTLRPGEAVGRHSTGAREEVILVLEGTGRVEVVGKEPLEVRAPMAAYMPPQQEHDVINTGTGRMRYIYVVAPVADAGV